MINLKAYLYEKAKPIIEGWDEDGIYAISFFVYSNLASVYQQYHNVSEFAVSYNTEKDCGNASKYCETRWNFAFWRQNTTHIINPHEENNEGMKILFQWYKENGIENIGVEDPGSMYDENHMYIGKGPSGYYELLTAVSEVARQMQTEGLISGKFGPIPIIVHGLEYYGLIKEATKHANPNGEADDFIMSMFEERYEDDDDDFDDGFIF